MSAFVEAVLVDWNDPDESDSELRVALDLPADKAYQFGLITATQRTEAMARARADTVRQMNEIIEGLDPGLCHLRPLLEQAVGNAREFSRIAMKHGLDFSITRASWRWPGRTVAEEAAVDAVQPVTYLAERALAVSGLLLEQAAYAAWQAAFDRYRDRV